jgi:thiol-disulfide isomerase/thioredoxin
MALIAARPQEAAADSIRWLCEDGAWREPGWMWIHVSASWCAPCQRVKAYLADPKIIRISRNFACVSLDADQDRDRVAAYGVKTIPCDLLVRPNRKTVIRYTSPVNSVDELLYRLGSVNNFPQVNREEKQRIASHAPTPAEPVAPTPFRAAAPAACPGGVCRPRSPGPIGRATFRPSPLFK